MDFHEAAFEAANNYHLFELRLKEIDSKTFDEMTVEEMKEWQARASAADETLSFYLGMRAARGDDYEKALGRKIGHKYPMFNQDSEEPYLKLKKANEGGGRIPHSLYESLLRLERFGLAKVLVQPDDPYARYRRVRGVQALPDLTPPKKALWLKRLFGRERSA